MFAKQINKNTAIPFRDTVIPNSGQEKPTIPTIGRGCFITFNYPPPREDGPAPLVLVTDVWPKHTR